MNEILDHFEEKPKFRFNRIILYAFFTILMLLTVNIPAIGAHYEYWEFYPVFGHLSGQLATGYFFLINTIFTRVILKFSWMISGLVGIIIGVVCFTGAFQFIVLSLGEERHFRFMMLISVIYCGLAILVLEILYRIQAFRKKQLLE